MGHCAAELSVLPYDSTMTFRHNFLLLTFFFGWTNIFVAITEDDDDDDGWEKNKVCCLFSNPALIFSGKIFKERTSTH